MKIGIPTNGNNGLNETIGEHFGRVNTYTIIDIEKDQVKTIQNTSHHMGGQGYPPELLKKEGVDVLVCRALGRRAISMFEENGIQVFIGATGTVKDAINAYKQGALQKASMDDACGRHAFRDQHHQH